VPKPRTLRKEQRRTARLLARQRMASALRDLIPGASDVPAEARSAFLDEINRAIVLVSRARVLAYTAALARGDSGGTDEPG
jgi:hypothetical protein